MAQKNIAKRLQDSAHAEALLNPFVNFLFAQPVASIIDVDHLLTVIDRALDETLTEDWIRDHLRPSIGREKERAKERNCVIGDWICPEMQAELRTLAMKPVRLDRAFLSEAVQQASVRHMLRSIIAETLDRFVNTLKPGGSGGGLLGSVGRGAFGLASRAGRGILGQIGGQVEEQLRQAAQAFVQSSTSVMLDRLVVLMSSDETARYLGQSTLAAYEAIIGMKTRTIWDHLDDDKRVDDVLGALPAQLAFLLRRPEVRDGLRAEVEAFLAIEGQRTIAEALGPTAYVDALKVNLVAQSIPIVTAFAATSEFKAWLDGSE